MGKGDRKEIGLGSQVKAEYVGETAPLIEMTIGDKLEEIVSGINP